MGLFNRLGREVEQFKQTAKDSAADQFDYRCEACDSGFAKNHDFCPDCGTEAVVDTTAESVEETTAESLEETSDE